MRCPRCDNDNLEPAQQCQVCGAPLLGASDSATSAPGTEPALASLLYRSLLGPVHTDYYLAQFARFDAAGKAGMSWNWPAFFATLAWLAFRRLWREALLFVGLSVTLALLLFGLATLVWGASTEELWALLGLYSLTLCVGPALWANALYYRHCNRQVALALAAAPNIPQACDRLAEHASSKRRAWFTAELTAGAWLLALALGVWLADASPGSATLAAATATREAANQATGTAPAPPRSAASAAAGPASAPTAPASEPVAVPTAPASAASQSAPPAKLAASAPGVALAVVAAPASLAAATSVPAPAAAASTPAKAVERQRPRPAKAPASSAKDGNKSGKFIVAVGQFAQEQNASRAYDKLEAAGLPVHSNTVQTATGTLVLIRVGPFASLAQARLAAQQIREMGLPAVAMKRPTP